MPHQPLRICKYAGCTNLQHSTLCEKHTRLVKLKNERRLAQLRKETDANRPSPSKRGYGREWKELRKEHLRANPWCVVCGVAATVVDHIQPHRGDRGLLLDPSNLQSMCVPHHNSKTAKEDFGFGKTKKNFFGN